MFTLLHSEWPKLSGVLAILCAIGLNKKYDLVSDHYFDRTGPLVSIISFCIY